MVKDSKKIKIANPFRKIYDMDRYKNPFNYPLPGFPYILDMEATNVCNLNCIMCPHQIMTRERGYMDFDIYKGIVDECAREGLLGMRFIRFGEPLLNPKIFEMIKYAKGRGIITHMTTNGISLTRSKAKKVIDSGIDSIIFSLQGTTGNEYERMRDNKLYGKLVSNIKYLVELRGEKDLSRPHIQVTTTTLDESKEEVDRFVREWSEIVDFVDCWYTSLLRLTDVERVKGLIARQTVLEHAVGGRCAEVMRKAGIDWNGDMTACCGDFDAELYVGTYPEKTIKELWNGEEFNAIRRILATGDRSKIEFCRLCTSKF